MSKGPTKAQQALTEAREWIEASKEEIREREAALVEAQGQLVMHETIYAVLEKALTRQSPQSKKSTKKTTRTATKSRRAASISDAIQGTAGAAGRPTGSCSSLMDGQECGAPASDPIHDPTFGYAGYHPFVESSSAPSAARGSSSKNGSPATSPASSETGTEGASNAVHAGG